MDTTLELFAGPGGWDTGIADLGVHPLGFEWDADAIATAMAANHLRYTVEGKGLDLSTLNPLNFATPGRVFGLIASPPCQGFSTAGKGKSRDDSALLLAGIRSLVDNPSGVAVDNLIASLRAAMTDTRSILVLEPLRWALWLRPAWLAFEQVPSVLVIWQAMAEVLEAAGYSVDTGTLSAEQYGVPQVRKRAFLVARRGDFAAEHGPAMLPAPTHSRYYPRSPQKLDEGLERWVSMGEALTWATTDLVGFPRLSDGRDEIVLDGKAYRARDLREAAYPAQTVTEKARSWGRWTFAGAGQTAVNTSGQRRRELHEPAHTITGAGSAAWVPVFNDQSGTEYDPEWPFKRPATTVAGRGLVQNPGATANRYNGSTKSRNDGVRVEVWEAGVLQSFPADYPWQGSRTSQYQRVGDAVPPLMARAIVSAVAAIDVRVEVAA